MVVSRIFYFGYSDARNGWNGNGKDSASENERMVLIFVTAVEEYVFQAFDVAAFHYLVKPFSDENLRKL